MAKVLEIRDFCALAIESHNETTAIASPTSSSLAFSFCHPVGYFDIQRQKIQDFHTKVKKQIKQKRNHRFF